MTPKTDYVFVRPKRDSVNRMSFSVLKNTGDRDHTQYLKDHVFLQMKEGTTDPMEEWVHKDDYEYYYQELHKHDELKEWNGSEEQKQFLEDLKEAE